MHEVKLGISNISIYRLIDFKTLSEINGKAKA